MAAFKQCFSLIALFWSSTTQRIGKGTFYDIEHSTKTDMNTVTISKSRFMGTAVVRAHAAEQCGGKGMRIFLDSSVDEDLQYIRQRVKTIAVAEPLQGVKWELDYLHEPRPIAQEQKVEADDRELFDKVARMKNSELAQDVQLQYTETLAAMNRMRIANSRSPVDLVTLRYGGHVGIWP